MNIVTIKDAVQSIAQSLQLSTIVPSMFLVTSNIWILNNYKIFDVSFNNEFFIAFVIFLTVSLSYILYAFNFYLIKVLEGYNLWNFPILRSVKGYKKKIYQKKFAKLKDNIENNVNDIEKLKSAQEIGIAYPPKKDFILPTRLGNIIASFEHYSFDRYGIDAVTMWSRLVPILKEKGYMEIVTQQKSVFDILMNLLVITTFVSIEILFFFTLEANMLKLGITFIICVVLILVLYKGVRSTATQWGLSIKVAFDLFRKDLRDKLNLNKDMSEFYEEFEQWKRVSDFIANGEEDIELIDFYDYSNQKNNS